MTAFRAIPILAAAATLMTFVVCTYPAFAQSSGQKMRAANLKTQQSSKRSFELDLGKLEEKRVQDVQRTATRAQRTWNKNHRVRHHKKAQGKRNMTRDQKNFGTLNR